MITLRQGADLQLYAFQSLQELLQASCIEVEFWTQADIMLRMYANVSRMHSARWKLVDGALKDSQVLWSCPVLQKRDWSPALQ